VVTWSDQNHAKTGLRMLPVLIKATLQILI
jgi:hypothetical protein